MRRIQSNTLDVGIDVHLKNWSTAILSKHSVLRRFLQVDCEGPTLISYIVAKHLAHASRGTISPYRTSGSAYGGFAIYMYLLIKNCVSKVNILFFADTV